jgi:hypothetical protein
VSIGVLLNLDGTLTRVTGADTVTEDHVPETGTQDVDVKCWFEQVRASEDTAGQDQQSEAWRVYLPAGTTCSGSDRLTVGDVVIEFSGPPWPAINPRTAVESHVEVTGKRVR